MQIAKYNASGNDFVIFHTFIKKDRSTLAQQLCDRQKGVGADGLIVLLPHETYDFEWQFYNNDGSVASMCGNGTRACAHYAFAQGLAPHTMQFLTGAGVITSSVDGTTVETELTTPKVLSESFEENALTWHFCDTGVPHLVTFVEDIACFDKTIARQMRYKYNANVNYTMLKDGVLHVRTYERGVEDETLACGTGACAAAVTGIQWGKLATPVTVTMRGGDLTIRWEGEGKPVMMTGPAVTVFEGEITI